MPPRNGNRTAQPDLAAAGAAVYANGFRTLEPHAASSGLRLQRLRLDSLRQDAGERVAEEFLLNSRLRRRDPEFEGSVAAYFTQAGAALQSLVDDGAPHDAPRTALPPPSSLPMALGSVVARRRSRRLYTGDSISQQDVATLAHAACGVTGSAEPAGGGAPLPMRSTPSGGGLRPVALQIAALRVDKLDAGIYVYEGLTHDLWRRQGDDGVAALLAAMAAPEQIISTSQAAALCLFVARPWRAMRKYGARGMRHVFIEAGAMAQQLSLAAVALGLGTVDCSSLYDDEAHAAIGADGLYEALVHCVIVGVTG
jgi:SagB-type dehydrogenase family enzyme